MLSKLTATALDTPGQTLVIDNSDGKLFMLCQYTITNINTSVTIRVEGSSDGTQWENLDSSKVDTVYLSNTTDSVYLSTAATIRVTFNLA
jgi:hypothetical protein